VAHVLMSVENFNRDAVGFIKLNALRLRTLAQRRKKLGL
jgi:argininosuccinate synthase